jgi:translation initiation factor 5A
VSTSTSKTGKHGHAKMSITALDIFTGKKYEMIETTSHNVEVPNVTKSEYTLVDIDEDGFMSLMDDQGNMKSDLKVPEDEVGQGIREFWDKKAAEEADYVDKDIFVTTQSAMNHEQAISFKQSKGE